MYIYRPVHYLLCFVCFLDVVLLVTCRKFTKQTNYAQEWVEWYKMTVSGFTSELFTLENTGGALQVKGFWYMLRFMYFEVDYLICLSRQNFRSQTKKYSSSGCTIDFRYCKRISTFGLGHYIKVRLTSLYFNQCSLNMCNYHI